MIIKNRSNFAMGRFKFQQPPFPKQISKRAKWILGILFLAKARKFNKVPFPQSINKSPWGKSVIITLSPMNALSGIDRLLGILTPISPKLQPSRRLPETTKHSKNQSSGTLENIQFEGTSIAGKKPVFSRTNTDIHIYDYLKKIIFDNKELGRKLRIAEDRNNELEEENSRINELYDNLRENFEVIKYKYKQMVKEPNTKVQQKSIEDVRTPEEEFLGAIMNGFARMSPPSPGPTNRFRDLITFKSRQSIEVSDVSIHPQLRKKFTLQGSGKSKEDPDVSGEMSLSGKTNDTETQTQCHLVCHQSPLRQSPSSHEAELLMQITSYKSTLHEIESKYNQLLVKYERIKGIISGEAK